jgi:hypothetical protein
MAAYELDIYKNGEKVETLKQIEAPWSLVKFCIRLWKNKDKDLTEKYQDKEDELIEDLITNLFKNQLAGRNLNDIEVSGKQVIQIVNRLMNETANGFASNEEEEKN